MGESPRPNGLLRVGVDGWMMVRVIDDVDDDIRGSLSVGLVGGAVLIDISSESLSDGCSLDAILASS